MGFFSKKKKEESKGSERIEDFLKNTFKIFMDYKKNKMTPKGKVMSSLFLCNYSQNDEDPSDTATIIALDGNGREVVESLVVAAKDDARFEAIIIEAAAIISKEGLSNISEDNLPDNMPQELKDLLLKKFRGDTDTNEDLSEFNDDLDEF